MKVGVVGLWHLGLVYSLGLAELDHMVTGYDGDKKVVQELSNGNLPLFEPGLGELLQKNLESGAIRFSNNANDLNDSEIILLTYDTPINDEDKADNEFVINEFAKIAKYINPSTKIVVTSQLPVGSSDRIRKILGEELDSNRVVVHPENLRLGKALDTFFCADRLIVGTADGKFDAVVSSLFARLNTEILWMRDKSAEMAKHALNSFLATSITFMGEISEICEKVGADAKEVEIALKSDLRIGYKAYLGPGLGFAGGTLARDIQTLSTIQNSLRSTPTIIHALIESNLHNNNWLARQLEVLSNKNHENHICFWGVTYTAMTSTLRRSDIYNIMKNQINANNRVSFVEDLLISDEIDPRMREIEDIKLSLQRIDTLVIAKKLEKYEVCQALVEMLLNSKFFILDPSRILIDKIPEIISNPRYRTVGVLTEC